MKKIGLYGGTFDPIHFGHLNLAFELMEKKGLDEVWFIPAQINPHKLRRLPTAIRHRLKMLSLALEEVPTFKIKDLEQYLPSPSYTIHTLQAFIAEEALSPSPHQFYLLMGEDAIANFSNWHLPEEIIKLAPLLIGSRACVYPSDAIQHSPTIQKAIQKGLVKTHMMDISATEVRERLAKGLYCGHLIPAKALAYIKQNELYF